MDKSITRRKNLQAIGEQLALLAENPDTPWLVQDGINEHLSQLINVVPIWNPRILRAAYWILCEEAEAKGVDLDDTSYYHSQIAAKEEEARMTM